ncbi:hypothetical protein OTU49_016720 [Cherax quadricarinatus]|uniref:SCP domain-containing protein n=2 Tax=Cherax quadricarinatus TaxID=27406 RepID=A0AAW0XW96_CHEQU
MGKCCSKPHKDYHTEEETQEVLLEVDPGGGGGVVMTGGTMIVKTSGRWGASSRGTSPTKKPTIVATSQTKKPTIVATSSTKNNTVVTTSPTKKPIIVTSPNSSATKTITITKGPMAETNTTGAKFTKTFHFSSSGAATETVSFSGQTGQTSTRFVTTKQGYVSGALTHTTTQVPSTAARVSTTGTTAARTLNTSTTTAHAATTGANITSNNKRSFFGIKSSFDQRMGKTKTETTTRTFTKNGTRYEETVEVVTKEDSDGNVTKTTKTTTKALDPYSTTEMAAAINDPKTSRKGHRKSSSSSSSPSPDRAKSSGASAKETGKSSKSGFRIKLRSGKTDDGDSSDDDDDFAKGVHKKVNHYRSKHGVSNLKLNKEMNKYAKEWAKKMAADDALSHRPDSKYGENVFCLSSNTKDFKVKADQVVDKWYDESKEHKFGVEPQGTVLKSGHFTQMVWKDTKQMGVGKARSAAGTKVFVVANFDPQGNWMGQFADQVPPVGGFPKPASSGKTSLFSSKTHKSSSDSDSSDDDDFAEECLKSHNNYRAKHGAPPLKLSKKLSKYAHEWAQTIAKKDVLQHRQNNSYGENLYCAWSSNPKHMIKGSEAVESWYQEIKDFTFGREPSDLRAGHFTQVVWLDSEELGVATARSKSGKIYVVANYSPAGNFVGSFATKVPRPK